MLHLLFVFIYIRRNSQNIQSEKLGCCWHWGMGCVRDFEIWCCHLVERQSLIFCYFVWYWLFWFTLFKGTHHKISFSHVTALCSHQKRSTLLHSHRFELNFKAHNPSFHLFWAVLRLNCVHPGGIYLLACLWFKVKACFCSFNTCNFHNFLQSVLQAYLKFSHDKILKLRFPKEFWPVLPQYWMFRCRWTQPIDTFPFIQNTNWTLDTIALLDAECLLSVQNEGSIRAEAHL